MKQPILIIENDPLNCMNIRQMLLALGVESPLIHANDGEGALIYLMQDHQMLPCLILLDLDTPAMGGIEFLNWLQSDERLRHIPVIVMAKAQYCNTITSGFGITDCVMKSDDYKRLSDEIGMILQKWFKDRPAA